MICNYCNDCADICNCGCKVTTTTTCIPVAEKPCITYCGDEDLFSDCIIYDGPTFSCYGINTGDPIRKILDIIIEKINLYASSCSYGNTSIIERITTTTTTIAPTTTTSTTTSPPVALCFSTAGEAGFSCFNENKQLIPTSTIINGKVSYSVEGTDLIIKWSIINNRWELYSTLDLTDLIAYLETSENSPVGPLLAVNDNPLNLVWQYPPDYLNIIVITRFNCPLPLCVTITNSIDANGLYQLKSFYDTLDNYPSSSITTKPFYFSCALTGPSILIKWNSFTDNYELYIDDIKVAYSNTSNIETINQLTWTTLPFTEYSDAVIKSKLGDCPYVEL